MTDHANTSSPAGTRPAPPLWTAWLAYWNGDLSQAERIISPEFVAHAAPLTGVGPSEIHGRDGINGWITGAHAVMQGLHFEVQVGPFVDGEFVLGRWRAQGTFQGMPGMTQDGPGRAVDFTGTDTLRVVDGRIVGSGCLNVMYCWGARMPCLSKPTNGQERKSQKRHPDVLVQGLWSPFPPRCQTCRS